MDAGGGQDNQDGRGDRTPPDERQIRLGRSRLTRGDESVDSGALSSDLIGGSSPQPEVAPIQPAIPPMAAPMGSAGSGPAAGGASVDGSAAGGSDSVDLASRFRPWSEPAAGNAGPMRCHFLRSVGPDGRLVEAQRSAVPTHRCAAFGDPLPLSLRQQELVCLQRVHVSCPRYVRGTVLANENPSVPAEQESRRRLPFLSIVGVGLVIVALLLVAAAAFGLPPFSSGGAKPTAPIAVATASPIGSGAIANATATPTASVVAATPSTPASVKPSASPTVVPTAKPTPTPTATPKPTPTPVPAAPTWPPGATASRMNLVVPCVGQANCYVYTVRGAGAPPGGNGSPVADTLTNVVSFFGVNMNQVKALNPGLGAVIKPGDKLKIPSPTR